MDAVARLDLAIFDAADIVKVGLLYAELTGWDIVRKDPARFGIRNWGHPARTAAASASESSPTRRDTHSA